MFTLFDISVYIFLFTALYAQIFILITFIEMKRTRASALHGREGYGDLQRGNVIPSSFEEPSVAIIVPCWNEENNLACTLDSLISLDYPREKLSIVVVNDGSTDGTLAVAERYATYPQVTVLSKENGGKHTALNRGIEHTGACADLIGCLDADSFVAPSALREIIRVFRDPAVMAVTPLIAVSRSKRVVERVQSVEYLTSGFLREVLGSINALFVTPGPFSFYRRTVFENIGLYRSAHQTEDLEIALRMHVNGMRITNTLRARVYTRAPDTFARLFRQRVRWHYGFLRNAIDYRRIFLRQSFGHVALFAIPAAATAVLSSIFLFAYSVMDFVLFAQDKTTEWLSAGFRFEWPQFEWFFIPTEPSAFIALALVALFVAIVWASRCVIENRHGFPQHFVYFFALYGIMAPLWYARALYNVVFSRGTPWR